MKLLGDEIMKSDDAFRPLWNWLITERMPLVEEVSFTVMVKSLLMREIEIVFFVEDLTREILAEIDGEIDEIIKQRNFI